MFASCGLASVSRFGDAKLASDEYTSPGDIGESRTIATRLPFLSNERPRTISFCVSCEYFPLGTSNRNALEYTRSPAVKYSDLPSGDHFTAPGELSNPALTSR